MGIQRGSSPRGGFGPRGSESGDTEAFFHTERIKLLRFRPLALFALTLKAPLHRPCVYSWGAEEKVCGGGVSAVSVGALPPCSILLQRTVTGRKGNNFPKINLAHRTAFVTAEIQLADFTRRKKKQKTYNSDVENIAALVLHLGRCGHQMLNNVAESPSRESLHIFGS